jgi:hypothetical protein
MGSAGYRAPLSCMAVGAEVKTPPLTERNLQRIILAALARDYPAGITYHCPNGGQRNAREGAELRKDGVLSGIPDLGIIRPGGRIGWLEIKTDVGVLSKVQTELHTKMLPLGHLVYVVRSLADVFPIIERWKLEDSISAPGRGNTSPI